MQNNFRFLTSDDFRGSMRSLERQITMYLQADCARGRSLSNQPSSSSIGQLPKPSKTCSHEDRHIPHQFADLSSVKADVPLTDGCARVMLRGVDFRAVSLLARPLRRKRIPTYIRINTHVLCLLEIVGLFRLDGATYRYDGGKRERSIGCERKATEAPHSRREREERVCGCKRQARASRANPPLHSGQ